MKSAFAGCFGFILGAILGAALGVGVGLLWTNVFHTSCFEGYCGMLVFFSFMPIGAIPGGLVAAALLIVAANQPPRPAAIVDAGDTASPSRTDDRASR